MRRGRIFIFLALILIIGLAVVALVFRQFLGGDESPTAETQQITTFKIYIAGQNIPQGAKITKDVLTTLEIPQGKDNDIFFTTSEEDELYLLDENKPSYAKILIEQGVPITKSMISKEELTLIPPGMTAIAIPTTRLASVAYGVRDGAHVDVSACFLFMDVDPSYQSELPNRISVLTGPNDEPPPNMPGITLGLYPPDVPQPQGRTEVEPAFQQGIYVVPSERQRPRLVCQIMMQNVIVKKLGTFPFEQIPVDTGQADQQQQAQVVPQADQNPDIVTLIVSPQDSIMMSYLIYTGAKITMTLRNETDDSRVVTEAATLQFLLSQYNIPVPAKLPYAMEPRVDELISPFLPGDVVTVAPEQ